MPFGSSSISFSVLSAGQLLQATKSFVHLKVENPSCRLAIGDAFVLASRKVGFLYLPNPIKIAFDILACKRQNNSSTALPLDEVSSLGALESTAAKTSGLSHYGISYPGVTTVFLGRFSLAKCIEPKKNFGGIMHTEYLR